MARAKAATKLRHLGPALDVIVGLAVAVIGLIVATAVEGLLAGIVLVILGLIVGAEALTIVCGWSTAQGEYGR